MIIMYNEIRLTAWNIYKQKYILTQHPSDKDTKERYKCPIGHPVQISICVTSIFLVFFYAIPPRTFVLHRLLRKDHGYQQLPFFPFVILFPFFTIGINYQEAG